MRCLIECLLIIKRDNLAQQQIQQFQFQKLFKLKRVRSLILSWLVGISFGLIKAFLRHDYSNNENLANNDYYSLIFYFLIFDTFFIIPFLIIILNMGLILIYLFKKRVVNHKLIATNKNLSQSNQPMARFLQLANYRTSIIKKRLFLFIFSLAIIFLLTTIPYWLSFMYILLFSKLLNINHFTKLAHDIYYLFYHFRNLKAICDTIIIMIYSRYFDSNFLFERRIYDSNSSS